MTKSIAAIKELTGFSDSEIEVLLQYFEVKKIKKKTIVLNAGETAKEVYYISSGCLRLFYQKDGTDISAYFFTDNMFAGAYDSFTTQQPSRLYIETLEDCEVFAISLQSFQTLFAEFPRMSEFVFKILQERFVSLHNLYTSQILDSPEERYLNLQKERPDLIQRIPQHHLATYLGITPVSLSRIRARLLKI